MDCVLASDPKPLAAVFDVVAKADGEPKAGALVVAVVPNELIVPNAGVLAVAAFVAPKAGFEEGEEEPNALPAALAGELPKPKLPNPAEIPVVDEVVDVLVVAVVAGLEENPNTGFDGVVSVALAGLGT